MTEKMKHGDIVTDDDGSKWYINAVSYHNGKVSYTRIRVGSLAAKMLGFESLYDDLEDMGEKNE